MCYNSTFVVIVMLGGAVSVIIVVFLGFVFILSCNFSKVRHIT